MTNIDNYNQITNEFKGINNRRYLILSLIFFVFFVALSIWGIIPQFNHISANKIELNQSREGLKNLENKIAQINEKTSDPEFAQAEKVNNILYSKNPFIEVLYTLNQVGSEHDILFDRLEYSPGLVATPSADFVGKQSAQTMAARSANTKINTAYTIFIEAKGTYYNLVNFLHSIENYAPFSSVAFSEINNSLLGYASAKIEILAQYYDPTITTNLTDSLPALSENDKKVLANLKNFKEPILDNLNQLTISNRDDIFNNIDISDLTPTTEGQTADII